MTHVGSAGPHWPPAALSLCPRLRPSRSDLHARPPSPCHQSPCHRGPTHPWGALRCRGTENSRDCRRRVHTAGFILTGACSGLVRGPSLQVTDGEMGGPLVPLLSCCSRFQGEACRQETGHTPRHRTLRFFPKEANGIFRSIPVLNSPAMSFGVGPSSSVFCLFVSARILTGPFSLEIYVLDLDILLNCFFDELCFSLFFLFRCWAFGTVFLIFSSFFSYMFPFYTPLQRFIIFTQLCV